MTGVKSRATHRTAGSDTRHAKTRPDFVEVGMGAEVIYQILQTFDVATVLADVHRQISEVKGEKRTKLLKKARFLESFTKSKIKPYWMMFTLLPVIPQRFADRIARRMCQVRRDCGWQ